MAKIPASDSIMAPDKMKPLLALSKREPVNAAIALSADGDAVILLDKKAKPRQVASLMRAGAGKAKITLNAATVRYGRAEVDTDYDAGMVRFFLNKDAPGSMRPKLVEVVKRMSYQKVELNVDPSIDAAAEEGEAPVDGENANPLSESTAAPASQPPQTTPATAPPDAASLSRELAALIGQIAAATGTDGARKGALAKLAGEANIALKAGNAAAASESIAKLRESLKPPAASPGDQLAELRERLTICVMDMRALKDPAVMAPLARSAQEIGALLHDGKTGPAASLIDVLETRIAEAVRATRQGTVAAEAGHKVEFGKLMLRWREAQETLETNLKTLGDTVLARQDIQEDPRREEIEQAIADLPDLIPEFGGQLEDALDAALDAVEAAERARLTAEAMAAIDAYRAELAGAATLLELEAFAAKDLGAGLPLHAALDQALVEMKQQLAA